MATIKGVWKISKFEYLSLYLPSETQDVKFTTYGYTTQYVRVAQVTTTSGSTRIWTYTLSGTYYLPAGDFSIGGEVNLTWDFGEYPQTVADGFLEWMLACGKQQVTEEPEYEEAYQMPASWYKEIADNIRTKTGKTELILTENMASEINGIETGITPTGTLDITANGTYDVTAKASAVVAIPTYDGTVVIS